MNKTEAYYAEDRYVGQPNYEVTELQQIAINDLSYKGAYGYDEQLSSVAPAKKSNDNQVHLESKDIQKQIETPVTDEHFFNETFQHLMCQNDSPEKFSLLSKCNQDFVYSVETFCKIIISEKNLPAERKTIKPVSIGGIAGGEKFIHRGILFKYAVDVLLKQDPKTGQCLYMYGGSTRNDELAMKAAGNELRALHRFAAASQKVKGVFTPLMSLCDFHGFRLIAMSLLPISKETIAYGSSDAGTNVHDDDSVLSEKMKQIGQLLNIKPHLVADKTLYGPGDIEGHKGMDGKLYALDFGRLYPPEAPSEDPEEREKSPRSIFYKHLRPELVKSNSVPLCSDAFSKWQTSDPNKEQHNKDVRDATKRMIEEEIPTFAKEVAEGKYSKQVLPVYAHRKGINCRHFGLVRSYSSNNDIWLTEMWIRCLKHIIYGQLRSHSVKERYISDITAKQLIADVLNLILVPGTKFYHWYWTTTEEECAKAVAVGVTDDMEEILQVPSRSQVRSSDSITLTDVALTIPSFKFSILNKFGTKALEQHEKQEDVHMYSKIFPVDGLTRLSFISSFKISPKAYPQLNEAKNFYFLDTDIISVEPKIKYASLIHFADGYTSLHKAMNLSQGTECKALKPTLRLLEDATAKLKLAWQLVPENEDVLYYFGSASSQYATSLQLQHAKKSKKDEEISYLAFLVGTDSLERVRTLFYEEYERIKQKNPGSTDEISMKSRILECHQRLCETYIWFGIFTTRRHKMLHSRDHSFSQAGSHFEEATKLDPGCMDFLLLEAFQNLSIHRAAVFLHISLVNSNLKNYIKNYARAHKDMFSRIDLSSGASDLPYLITDLHMDTLIDLFSDTQVKSINLIDCSCLSENAVIILLKHFGEHLEELSLSNIKLGENTMTSLYVCKHLKVLNLKQCALADSALRKLLPGLWKAKDNLPHILNTLEELSVEGNKQVTSDTIVTIVKKSTQLKKLNLRNCNTKDSDINELNKIKSSLEIQYTTGDSGISEPMRTLSNNL